MVVRNEWDDKGNYAGNPNERGVVVSEVRVGKDESIESALKRFKKKCQNSGILKEVRRREHYEKPSVRRKKKAIEARKKSKKFR